MTVDTKAIKPFVMPSAIILGLIFHDFCASMSVVVPYLIFSILILTFSTTRLVGLRFEKLDFWLMLCQTVGTLVLYFAFMLISGSRSIAEGMMLGALTPVASSVTVVSIILGARRESTIAYTILGNLLVCVLAPVTFLLIGRSGDMSLTDSFFAIFGKIATVIGLPFFVVLFMQLWVRPLSRTLCRISGLSFYLWAAALFFSLGQTIDFIFLHGEGHWYVVIALAVGSFIICPLQFYIGSLFGKKFGDPVAGKQLLGQKNSAMGIWMSNTYLDPLSSSFMAFYSIWQNLLNSYQIWRKTRR